MLTVLITPAFDELPSTPPQSHYASGFTPFQIAFVALQTWQFNVLRTATEISGLGHSDLLSLNCNRLC